MADHHHVVVMAGQGCRRAAMVAADRRRRCRLWRARRPRRSLAGLLGEHEGEHDDKCSRHDPEEVSPPVTRWPLGRHRRDAGGGRRLERRRWGTGTGCRLSRDSGRRRSSGGCRGGALPRCEADGGPSAGRGGDALAGSGVRVGGRLLPRRAARRRRRACACARARARLGTRPAAPWGGSRGRCPCGGGRGSGRAALRPPVPSAWASRASGVGGAGAARLLGSLIGDLCGPADRGCPTGALRRPTGFRPGRRDLARRRRATDSSGARRGRRACRGGRSGRSGRSGRGLARGRAGTLRRRRLVDGRLRRDRHQWRHFVGGRCAARRHLATIQLGGLQGKRDL